MGSFYETFRSGTPGSMPSGWTEVWEGGGTVDWKVQNEASALGGKVLEITGPTSSGAAFLKWDGPSADADRADVEVLMRLRATSHTAGTGGYLAAWGRQSGASEAASSAYQGRAIRVDAVENLSAALFKILSGTTSDLDEFDVLGDVSGIVIDPYPLGDWFRLRFRLDGDLLFLRIWPDADDEPSAWHVEGVDADITAAGNVGLQWQWGHVWQVDWIAVETGGGTAVPDFVASGDVSLSGAGSLTLDPQARRFGAADLSGVAFVDGYWDPDYAASDYTILGLVRATIRRLTTAALEGLGALVTAGLRRAVPTIALSGAGSLAARGIHRITTGLSALVGAGALSAALRLKQLYLKTVALITGIETNAELGESANQVTFGTSSAVVVWRQTMPFTIKKGDTKPVLSAFLQESNGDPIDLTGATVRVIMVPAGGGAAKVNALATIIDAPNGEIEYQWFEGDTDTAGGYVVEFEVTYPPHTVGPAATISFDASDNSINDSGNGLAGFSVGDTIQIAGSASNDGAGKAQSVAAGKVVIDNASRTIVTEGAGASITLTHNGHRITVPNATKGAEVTITEELGSAP